MSVPIPPPLQGLGNSAEIPSTCPCDSATCSTSRIPSDSDAAAAAHGGAHATKPASMSLRSSYAIEMCSKREAVAPSASGEPKSHALSVVVLRNIICLVVGVVAMRYAENVYAHATDSMALGAAFDRQLKYIVSSALLYLVASRVFLFCDLSHFRAFAVVFIQALLFFAPLFVCMSFRTADYLAPKNGLTNLSQEYIIILFAIIELALYAVASGCLIAFKFLSIWQIAGTVSIFWATVAMLTWSNLTAARASTIKGVSGKQMSQQHSCRVDFERSLMLMDALPRRSTNFFTGSERCASVPRFSQIKDRRLVIDTAECERILGRRPILGAAVNSSHANAPGRGLAATATLGDMYYVRHSDFWSQRSAENRDGLDFIVDRQHEERVAYTRPVELVGDEYVEVYCGDRVNFLVHNYPNQTKMSQRRSSERLDGDQRPDIAMFMIDAFSRLHFHRRMTAVKAMLEKINSGGEHTVFEFFRYTAVGERTCFTVPAMLAGLSGFGKPNKPVPLVWNYLSENGYASTYMLNHCENYFRAFFASSTTEHLDHHYVRAFCNPEYDKYQKWTNFDGPYSMGRRCIAGRHVHQYTLDYVEQIWDNYANRPKFLFTSLIEAHEGSGAHISAVDKDLARFMDRMFHASLPEMRGKSKFRDTIFFLLADHGSHMGPYAMFSEAGKLEHKLPAFFLIVPNRYLKAHPLLRDALRANEQQIVTAYDVYATIIDIAAKGDPDHELYSPNLGNHSKSLFGAIDPGRTCEQAHIHPKMCVCPPKAWRKNPAEAWAQFDAAREAEAESRARGAANANRFVRARVSHDPDHDRARVPTRQA